MMQTMKKQAPARKWLGDSCTQKGTEKSSIICKIHVHPQTSIEDLLLFNLKISYVFCPIELN